MSLAVERIFPWQQTQWHMLQQCWQTHHLPHALLFSGCPGTGKKHFARALAVALLCHTPCSDGTGCGMCRQCQLVRAGTHPDVFCIAPEDAGQMIRVDVIRAMNEFVYASAMMGRHKIILLDAADRMNIFAANALLKSLEEPPANTCFILISAVSQRLPATVRSRCQDYHFMPPGEAEAFAFLQGLTDNSQVSDSDVRQALAFAGGAPLRALALLEKGSLVLQQDFYQDLGALVCRQADPIILAEKWSAKEIQEKSSLLELVDWFYLWLKNFLIYKITGTMTHSYFITGPCISQSVLPADYFGFIDYVMESSAALRLSPQLNRQLFLESLFIPFVTGVR